MIDVRCIVNQDSSSRNQAELCRSFWILHSVYIDTKIRSDKPVFVPLRRNLHYYSNKTTEKGHQ